MKSFKELQIGDVIYAIDHKSDISICTIEGIMPRSFSTKDLDGKIYGYDIIISFENDERLLYYIFIESRIMNENIKQTKIYTDIDNTYKDKDFPYYLIGTDEKSLIEYYVNKLEESIAYQQEVISYGQKYINKLEDIVQNYKQFLENYTITPN